MPDLWPYPEENEHAKQHSQRQDEASFLKFQIACVVLVIISCPRVLFSVLYFLNLAVNGFTYTYIAGAKNRGAEMGNWLVFVAGSVMVVATLVPIMAIRRATALTWNRRFIVLPVVSLLLVLTWWLLIFIIKNAAIPHGRYSH